MTEPRRNLVFTSAGDRSNVRSWLHPGRAFDLWVTYYGDLAGTLADVADHYAARKGSKFQNLAAAYAERPEVFAGYDAVLVIDDDIVIAPEGIDRLFDIRRTRDLWVLQPAFRPRGRISHSITRQNPLCTIRLVNFVEVTCPLFRRDALDRFMREYDGSLVGFGIEWWFLETLGPDLRGRVAVVDEVPCINPHERRKGGGREIDTLQDRSQRERSWLAVKNERGITSQEQPAVVYASEHARPAAATAATSRYVADWAYRIGEALVARAVRTARDAAPALRRIRARRPGG